MGLHKGEKYSETVRKFALTLRFYSPRAYDYVREKFDRSLPHPVTIKKWYQQSTVLASSGLCNRTIELLKEKAKEMDMKGEKLYCAVIHDEMNIRQQIQWANDKKSFSGLITFGKVSEDAENLPMATQVLVFLVSGINIPFHLPIAYYFVASLEGIDKVVLMKSIRMSLANIGVIELANVFDGHSTNITACEIMGSSFDFNDFHPQFINDDDEIFPFLDPAHMLKLIRNVLADKKKIYDRLGRPIEWKYYEMLVDLKEKDDFNTHKLTRAHINYHRNDMKVSLAAQIFSNSTASSLQSLMDRNYPGFEDATGTIEFTSRIDNLFNVMMSEKQCENIYKSPITPETSSVIFSFLDDTAEYLKGLTFEKGKNAIVESRSKVGFKGMIIDIANVKQIYEKFVQTNKLHEFCVRRVIQCPLESLFSRCRSHAMLGTNTNPTTVQFTSTIRKILVNNEVTSSLFANTSDKLDILQISSYVPKKTNTNFLPIQGEAMTERSSATHNISIDDYTEEEIEAGTSAAINTTNVDEMPDFNDELNSVNKCMGLATIAGEIDQRIKRKNIINCDLCRNVPFENETLILETFPTSKYNKLPCRSTYDICTVTNRILEPKMLKIDFNYDEIVRNSLSGIDLNSVFQNSCFTLHTSHKIQLIQSIVETFISIKAAYVARKRTLENYIKIVESKKRKLSKTKHFQGR